MEIEIYRNQFELIKYIYEKDKYHKPPELIASEISHSTFIPVLAVAIMMKELGADIDKNIESLKEFYGK